MLEHFHFIRPLWLIGLLPVILLSRSQVEGKADG